MLVSNKYYLVFPFIFSMMVFSVTAEGFAQGEGRVNMQGSIIDTPCTIAVESRDQTINMNTVPIADIIRDGQGGNKKFSIELVNCSLEQTSHKLPLRKKFRVTFDGDAEDGLFSLHGTVSGIALKIIDKVGNMATPGKHLPLEDIVPGSMQLNYTLKLVANNHALKSGDYFSYIRFKLDYF